MQGAKVICLPPPPPQKKAKCAQTFGVFICVYGGAASSPLASLVKQMCEISFTRSSEDQFPSKARCLLKLSTHIPNECVSNLRSEMRRFFMQQLRTKTPQRCVCFYLNAAVLKPSLRPTQSPMQRLHCLGCHDNSCHYESGAVIGGRRTGTWPEERGVTAMRAQSPWTQVNPISGSSLCQKLQFVSALHAEAPLAS